MDSGSDMVVLDVREVSEFCSEQGHIPGALNYPYDSGILESRYDELNPDDETVVVCASGNRSVMASIFLEDKGFSAILNMEGGMGAWESDTEICDETPAEDDQKNEIDEDGASDNSDNNGDDDGGGSTGCFIQSMT